MSANHNYVLESQDRICAEACAELGKADVFVLLSGDSGSGRTAVCERVINFFDGKMRTVFLPCQEDMSVQNLREFFLQQLLPGEKWDLNLNLADLLMRRSIPDPRKVLVVADDADKVINAFYEELATLFGQQLGRGRFAFLLTGKPLWVQNKQDHGGKIAEKIISLQIPALSMNESMTMLKNMFSLRGYDGLYEALRGKLPAALERCSGNITKVIKFSENVMENPKILEKSAGSVGAAALKGGGVKTKKHGLTGIFITLFCIGIVLCCLVPLFMGSDFFSGLFGGSSDSGSSESAVQGDPFAQSGVSGEAGTMVLQQGPAGTTVTPAAPGTSGTPVTAGTAETAEAGGTSSALMPGLGTPEGGIDDPLRSTPSEAVNLSAAAAPRGTADQAVTEEGGLLPDLKEGISVDTPDDTLHNSVTLRGETLEQIERQGAESEEDTGLPRRGLLGGFISEAQAAPVAEAPAVPEPQPEILTRADNSLHLKEIEAERAQAELLAKQKAEEEEQAKEKAAAEAKAKAEEEAKQRAAEQSLIAAAAAEKEKKDAEKKSKPMATSGAAAGKGVPGQISELLNKNPGHFTLQVVAGRKRKNVEDVAAAVSGRYWIYETILRGEPWFILVAGDYLTAGEAMKASRSLPAYVKKAGPFAKNFSQVQREVMRMQRRGR